MKDYILTVTEDDLKVLSLALAKQPFELVAPLFNKLNIQVAEQRRPDTGSPTQPAA